MMRDDQITRESTNVVRNTAEAHELSSVSCLVDLRDVNVSITCFGHNMTQ